MLESSLAPGLLLAMPQLMDPNFRRSVVLMVEDNEQGSFGLVVNRPAGLRIADVLKEINVKWQGDPDTAIGYGGPVMTASGWLLWPSRPQDDSDDNSIVVAPGISLSTSKEALDRFAAEPPQHFRFILGYAGWGPGQLADELADGAWLQATATTELVFHTDPDDMWQSCLQSIGVDPAAVAPSDGVQ